ncbi:MAG: hypothetical protein AB1679_30225 [Actinomycetota bacterium]
MRRARRALAGLTVLTASVVGAPAPAWPEGDGGPPTAALFTAEVFATPSYHLMEIPKVEEGGEGFAWAYLNQQPESWGRAISFWPGPTPNTVFETSTPQQGPLAGHGYKAPGAWTSYPTGGDSAGTADFGEPAQFPLGPTVDTPGGTMRIFSFSGHADANEGIGEFAFGAFTGTAVPVNIGFARSHASARRDGDAVVSSGWALARDVKIGDVGITEIRSDAVVRATAAGETGTWTLTVSGVSVGGQRLEWTDKGVSFAPGSEDGLTRLNAELAKGAESLRSEFKLIPGRVWRDDAGTHVQSGFLQMGHRPVILENNPGQKMVYALSVVSAQAFYRLEDPAAGLDDDLPLPAVEGPSTPEPLPAVTDGGRDPAAVDGAPSAAGLLAETPAVLFDPAPAPAYGSAVGDTVLGPDPASVPPPSGEAALAVPGLADGSAAGRARAAPAAVAGLGEEAARDLRGGIGVMALAALVALLAVLRVARRQLELVGTSKGGR